MGIGNLQTCQTTGGFKILIDQGNQKFNAPVEPTLRNSSKNIKQVKRSSDNDVAFESQNSQMIELVSLDQNIQNASQPNIVSYNFNDNRNYFISNDPNQP